MNSEFHELKVRSEEITQNKKIKLKYFLNYGKDTMKHVGENEKVHLSNENFIIGSVGSTIFKNKWRLFFSEEIKTYKKETH